MPEDKNMIDHINAIDKILKNSKFIKYPSEKEKKKCIKKLKKLRKGIMNGSIQPIGYNTLCLD